jgi:hypothetical protein
MPFVSEFKFFQFNKCSTLGIPVPDELSARFFVANTQLGSGASCSVHPATDKVNNVA